MAPISFRNSKIIYYGPHECDNCGILIAKMGHEWGGSAFTYPEGPIYPNTEWHVHVCDHKDVWAHSARAKKREVQSRFGAETRAVKSASGAWKVFDPSGSELFPNAAVHCSTELDAFCYVFDRMKIGE